MTRKRPLSEHEVSPYRSPAPIAPIEAPRAEPWYREPRARGLACAGAALVVLFVGAWLSGQWTAVFILLGILSFLGLLMGAINGLIQ